MVSMGFDHGTSSEEIVKRAAIFIEAHGSGINEEPSFLQIEKYERKGKREALHLSAEGFAPK